MKWLQEEEERFTRLASFVCDSDDEEPLSEKDIAAIEAIEAEAEARFQSNPNNKKRPFTPCRRRLPTSLVALQHPAPFSFSPSQHPGYSKMRLPVMKFSGQIMYSRTFDDVQNATTKLLQVLEEKKKEMVQIALGFDIEWRPTFRKGFPPGKVAVMQICDGTSHCHVLHLIHSGIPPNLQLLLEDPLVLKVGAGISNDAGKVFRDYNISIKGVEDLSFHANRKLSGGPQKWGLASLTEKLLSKQLTKPSKIRLGNWETPVLSKEQLQYAATDAFASWYLYQAIKDLPDILEVSHTNGEVEGVPQQ